jgi:hypothetical protein
MLTTREYAQIHTAISYMHAPYSINGEEACYKKHVYELLVTYMERDDEDQSTNK